MLCNRNLCCPIRGLQIFKGALLGGSRGSHAPLLFYPPGEFIHKKKICTCFFIFPEIPRLVHPCYLGRMGTPANLISLIIGNSKIVKYTKLFSTSVGFYSRIRTRNFVYLAWVIWKKNYISRIEFDWYEFNHYFKLVESLDWIWILPNSIEMK